MKSITVLHQPVLTMMLLTFITISIDSYSSSAFHMNTAAVGAAAWQYRQYYHYYASSSTSVSSSTHDGINNKSIRRTSSRTRTINNNIIIMMSARRPHGPAHHAAAAADDDNDGRGDGATGTAAGTGTSDGGRRQLLQLGARRVCGAMIGTGTMTSILDYKLHQQQSSTGTSSSSIAGNTQSRKITNHNNNNNVAWALQDSLDIESYLRTGLDPAGPMGVSGQAGKSKPETGVLLRDGYERNQDNFGSVSAEILLSSTTSENNSNNNQKKKVPVFITFTCPLWKLETSSPIFDIECRDSKNGDNIFVVVPATRVSSNQSIEELPTTFFYERLFDKTGRFSIYGTPTDIKVIQSKMISNNRRLIEIKFSTLSQSTNTEIPRQALLIATIPSGTNQVVMLVGSSSALRWKKNNINHIIEDILKTFQAIPAPQTNLKIKSQQQSKQQQQQ